MSCNVCNTFSLSVELVIFSWIEIAFGGVYNVAKNFRSAIFLVVRVRTNNINNRQGDSCYFGTE